MNIELTKHCPHCRTPIRLLVASHECDQRLVEQNDYLRKQLNKERCDVCNGELSQCGPPDDDGEPTLDCLVCKLRAIIDDLRSQVHPKCEDCEKGSRPKLLDRDGVLSSLSGKPGTWCHAYEEFYWPCPVHPVQK